jgi:hypothetical protein
VASAPFNNTRYPPPPHPQKTQGVYYSLWPAPGHVHPKLRLKEKPSLISLAGGVDGLRVTDPKARAEPLDPRGWKEMLRKAEEINGKVDAGEEDEVGPASCGGPVVGCNLTQAAVRRAVSVAVAAPSCPP